MQTKIRNNWTNPPPTPPDPILDLLLSARKDSRPKKVDLSAGVYRDETLGSFLLPSVISVIDDAISCKNTDIFKSLPPHGDLTMADLLFEMCFGAENKKIQEAASEGRWGRIHCQSGGNGLYFIFEIIKHFFPKFVLSAPPEKTSENAIWCAQESWPIHFQMMNKHNLRVRAFRYYNPAKNQLDFDSMLEDFEKGLLPGDMILLQPCGHNPTGFDLSNSQWDILAKLMKSRGAFAIFDFAYMGYASGKIDDDCYPVRLFVREGLQFFLTIACSKNFGVYGARVGSLGWYFDSADLCRSIDDYAKKVAWLFYRGPNSIGAHIVREILSSKERKANWLKDLDAMTARIRSCRIGLLDALEKTGSKRDWGFITRQFGMFAYTGLTEPQTKRLREEFAIYVLATGRISTTGLNKQNIPYVADAFNLVTSEPDTHK